MVLYSLSWTPKFACSCTLSGILDNYPCWQVCTNEYVTLIVISWSVVTLAEYAEGQPTLLPTLRATTIFGRDTKHRLTETAYFSGKL